MAQVCELTGKKPAAGRNIQHHSSIGWRYKAPRTTRTFDLNLRRITVKTDTGTVMKVSTSMKAYKKLRKQGYYDVKGGLIDAKRVYLFTKEQQKAPVVVAK